MRPEDKNDELAKNYYKRVSNFAKEMLVQPETLNVHRNSLGVFSSDSRGNRRDTGFK